MKRRGIKAVALLVVLLVSQAGFVNMPTGLSSDKAGFTLKFKEETSSYRVMSLFTLPGEKFPLEVLEKGKYDLQTSLTYSKFGRNRWEIQAPSQKGIYPLEILGPENDSMTLQIFVMIPFARLKQGYLNGYRIGSYPSTPLNNLPIYNLPKGFVEVTPDNEDLFLTPHFQLKQFVAKQESAYPKYIVLRERLLLNLELVLEEVNKTGFPAESLFVMSGYRTPYYNQAIGNETTYSRHTWGDAADIFVDANKDSIMDDLNRDGKIDPADAAVLFNLIDRLYEEPWYSPFVGGLARYNSTEHHGPFVHLDVRGTPARW